ncbi:hypothetical protein GXW82_43090 [Streptacidiphilus sp. 4-A2]|nr:hypothetical protein [Streptacidiphilus sp. 4-A2]
MNTMVRAAEMSPAEDDRVSRLAKAAYGASLNGQLGHAERLLADVWRARARCPSRSCGPGSQLRTCNCTATATSAPRTGC